MARPRDVKLLPPHLPAGRFPADTLAWPGADKYNERIACFFVKAEHLYSHEGIRAFCQSKNSMSETNSRFEKELMTTRLCYEWLANAAVDPGAGTVKEVENEKYLEYKAKYADQMAAFERQEPGVRRPPGPTVPQYNKLPSRTYEAPDGTEHDKVDTFIQVGVRKEYDDVIDMFSTKNIVGYGFIWVARDPNFTFSGAVKALLETLNERLKLWNEKGGSKGTSFTKFMRQMDYGLVQEDELVGYETILSEVKYDMSVANAYASMHDIPVVYGEHRVLHNVSMFSWDNYVKILAANGVCASQCETGPRPENIFEIRGPACCVAQLTMDEAAPAKFVRTAFPWHVEVEAALMNPLKPFKTTDIGYGKTNARDSTLNAVESLGMALFKNLNAVEEDARRPYERAAKQYHDDLNRLHKRKMDAIRIAKKMDANQRAELQAKTAGDRELTANEVARLREHNERAVQLRRLCDTQPRGITLSEDEKKDPNLVLLCEIMHRQECGAQSVSWLDISTLKADYVNTEALYTRLKHHVHEDFARFMRRGNPDLPPAMQAVLDWAHQNGNKITFGNAMLGGSDMPPFGNILSKLNTLMPDAFSFAGSTQAMIAMVFGVMGHTQGGPDKGYNIQLLGAPSTGKSKQIRAVKQVLIPGTADYNTGGGSDKNAFFARSEGGIELMDEMPEWMVGERGKGTSAENAKHLTALESFSSNELIYHQTRQLVDPTSGRQSYTTVKVRTIPVNTRLMASNVSMKNEAMASRFTTVPVQAPRGGNRAAVDRQAYANQTVIDGLKDVVAMTTQTFQWLAMLYLQAMAIGAVPPPSNILIHLQIGRTSEVMEEFGIAGFTPRKINSIIALYNQCVLMYAMHVAYLSEISPSRNAHVNEYGDTVFEPLEFKPEMVSDMVPHVRDNEDPAIYVLALRFNDMVNEFEFSLYRIFFTRLLLNAAYTPNQLAKWVRYVGLMPVVTKDFRDVGFEGRASFPYFHKTNDPDTDRGNPEDPQQVYAFGEYATQAKWRELPVDPLLAVEPVPAGVYVPTEADYSNMNDYGPDRWDSQTNTWGPNAPNAPNAPNGNAARNGAAFRLPPLWRHGPSFTYRNQEFHWSRIHPEYRKFVPARPKDMFRGPNIRLMVAKDANGRKALDPNYIQVDATSLKDLINKMCAVLRENTENGWTGDVQTVRDIIYKLPRKQVKVCPLKLAAPPPLIDGKECITQEWFAERFLLDNVEADKKHMDILKLHTDYNTKKETVYVLSPLIIITAEHLRDRYEAVHSHKYARPRIVPTGPSLRGISSMLDVLEIKKNDAVIKFGSKNGASRMDKVMLRNAMMGHQSDRIPIMPANSPYHETEMEVCVSLVAEGNEVNDDIERFCSSHFCSMVHADDTSLPANVHERYKQFLRDNALQSANYRFLEQTACLPAMQQATERIREEDSTDMPIDPVMPDPGLSPVHYGAHGASP